MNGEKAKHSEERSLNIMPNAGGHDSTDSRLSLFFCIALSQSLWLAILQHIAQRILRAKAKSDSVGGTVTCVIRNVPGGLGEPCFDKLEAVLAHAMLSIPSTKGFEIGSGFKGTEMSGSSHNDLFVRGPNNKLRTTTNRSGGIQGGISNGENIYFR